MVKYFAYGSNMIVSDVLKWCQQHHLPPVTFSKWQIAVLSDYELRFNAFSMTQKCGVANIMMCPGSFVEGVLFDVDEKDMDRIRHMAGVPGFYNEMHISVKLKNGTVVENVKSFKVLKVFQNENARPTKEYLNKILDAAHTFALGETYIKQLETVECM